MERIAKSYLVLFVLVGLVAAPVLAEGYLTTVGDGADAISVVVVRGTPYEMGHAFGTLMRDEVAACMGGYLAYARQSGVPLYSDESLDAAWAAVAPHTDQRFKDELRGLADASGVSMEELIRAHMIPVVSSYSCSGVAVWDEATANDNLYQIRNLDFTMNAGLQDFPVVVVYLPEQGLAHANVTFAGCIGCNTGMNVAGIALSEKGASPRSDMPYDINGEHFMMLFRDILYDAGDLETAVRLVQESPRIKKYRFYIGDGQGKKAVKIRAYAPDLDIWPDNDPTDEVAPNILKNVIYYTMNNQAAFTHLTENYGTYDIESVIALSRLVADDDGNLLNVVYDATALEMRVAYAEGLATAATRPYVALRLRDYLNYNPEGAVKTAETPKQTD
ncbi:MAG: C45 family autoproteolytic acyltransferase/hydrolase [Candidatus Hydrogenedentales bacterium]|jgi:isopenicillin-N N-acyltransferase-like protein